MSHVVLVGDIGGTHARLSLLAPSGRTVAHKEFESHRYGSLEDVVRVFLGAIEPHRPKVKVLAAAFGIAGPVVNGRCVATNLPWRVDARALARKLSIRRVVLLNDLVALSLGAVRMPRAKLHVLNGTRPPRRGKANVAVIAAGTGLGEAILVWDGGRFVPNATEGGHADFAPRDDLEIELLQFLRARFGRVSWERVLSGSGLGNLYDFFCQKKGLSENSRNARVLADAPDRNATITQLGLAGASEAASRAVDLFASIYGAEAGNLALKSLSVGGVYVCGNIAVRMIPALDRGGFRRAFVAKGRMATLLEKIPVAIVCDSDVGLAGAASVALE